MKLNCLIKEKVKPRIQTENTMAETLALDILLKCFYYHVKILYR